MEDNIKTEKKPVFIFRRLHVRFMMDKVPLEQVFLQVPSICIVNHHFSTSSFSYITALEVIDSPDQAAHYHILSLKFGTSSLNRHLTGYTVRKLSYFFLSTIEVVRTELGQNRVRVQGRIYSCWDPRAIKMWGPYQ
jgi:hypothetical protein